MLPINTICSKKWAIPSRVSYLDPVPTLKLAPDVVELGSYMTITSRPFSNVIYSYFLVSISDFMNFIFVLSINFEFEPKKDLDKFLLLKLSLAKRIRYSNIKIICIL